MSRSARWFVCLSGILLGLLLSAAPGHAQPKPGYAPTSTHIFPAGARRGSTVSVLVGTECAPPGTELLFGVSGIAASRFLEEESGRNQERDWPRLPTETPITYPREWKARVSVPADFGGDCIPWRISCAQGGTASRPFLIGDLPEWIENESNSIREQAENVTLPITLNGQIAGERDIDFYRFHLRRNEPLTCTVFARRLGSPLEPVVEISTLDGDRIEGETVYIGEDPVLVVSPPATGDYVLSVANLSFHGDVNFVYRVNLLKQPLIESVFPSILTSGIPQEVCFRINKGSKKRETVCRTIQTDAPPGTRFHWRDADDVWMQHTFSVGQDRMCVESDFVVGEEGSDHPEAMLIGKDQDDVLLAGRIDSSRDRDQWVIPVSKGEVLAIASDGLNRVSDVIPRLQITDAFGAILAAGLQKESLPGRDRIDWVSDRDGEVYLGVRDLRFGAVVPEPKPYYLTIKRNPRDFQVEIDSDQINLEQGKTTEVQLNVWRSEDCQGEIGISMHPKLDGIEIVKQSGGTEGNRITLELRAHERCPSRTILSSLVAVLQTPDRVMQRFVTGTGLGRDSEGVAVGTGQSAQIGFTVAHRPVFRLYCEEAYQYAYRGSVFEYPMTIERLDDYAEPIVLQIGDRQNRDLDGIQMRTVSGVTGFSQIQLPIYLPETMAINVQSQSQLYSQAYSRFIDEFGRRQAVLVLSEKRNMIRTLPPVVKLIADQARQTIRENGIAEFRLRLDRTTNFPERLGLVLMEAGPFEMEPQEFKANQNLATIRIRLDRSARPGLHRVTVRGTGDMDGTEVISETVLTLDVTR